MPQTPVSLNAPPISLERAEEVSGLASWHETDVQALSWAPAAQAVVVATSQSVHFVNVPTQGLIRSLYPTLQNVVRLEFDPYGSWLVVGTRNGSEEAGFRSGLELWQAPNWRPLGVLYGTDRPLTDMAFSPGATYLAVAYTGPRGANSGVDLWYAPTWTISTTIDTGQALDVAFSPDASLLAVSPDRYSLRVYNIIDRQWLYNLPTSFTGSVNALAFSPDGFTLASGHYDGMVRLWDMRSGDLLLEFPTDAVVQSLAFSPDGRILATGSSYENTLVRLWSVGSGVLLRELVGHTKGVTHLAFSPDSQFLVSASYDGMVRIWGMPPNP
jgi:WD40 repeat protein